ncbi:hypothetical protein C8T65DRAFT_828364 [Cerioporus squamosus]|nr:hypothetical protein C8T65DRAFT_828364 [Cerioporus squamosus]
MLVRQRWHKLISHWDPALWNEVDLVNNTMSAVPHLLERSKAAYLHVRFAYPACVKDGHKVISSFLKNHAHRFLLPLLDVSMPRLTCLVLSLRGTKALPNNVHGMSFARFTALMALALCGTLLLPKAPILSFTHLHVVAVANDSILPLMDILRAKPAWEVLDLRTIRLHTRNVNTSSVALPLLHLVIGAITYELCLLLHNGDRVLFPALVSLRFDMWYFSHITVDAIAPALEARGQTAGPLP